MADDSISTRKKTNKGNQRFGTKEGETTEVRGG